MTTQYAAFSATNALIFAGRKGGKMTAVVVTIAGDVGPIRLDLYYIRGDATPADMAAAGIDPTEWEECFSCSDTLRIYDDDGIAARADGYRFTAYRPRAGKANAPRVVIFQHFAGKCPNRP